MATGEIETMALQVRVAVDAVAPGAEFRTRAMFGGAGAYAGERMFASLSSHGLALKLPDEAQADLLRLEGAKRLQYDVGKPPSRTYVLVPATMRGDPHALAPWVRRSIDFAASLPAKKPRTRRAA